MKKEKKREEEKCKGKFSFFCCENPFAFLDNVLVSLNFISMLLLKRSLWGKTSKNLARKVRDDTKGGGLACICKCFLYELHVAVNTCMICVLVYLWPYGGLVCGKGWLIL